MPYRISRKYKPLWNATTRYVIVTGGRGSGKSYALACSMLDRTYEDGYNILYTRWNLTSAEVSIIPEFVEKMDIGNCRNAFVVRQRDVQNVSTGGRIWFRGLQTASKSQIARMKSLNRLKIWVLDEAQELMSESTFDTIDQSIREKDADNLVVLVLNPADISHWIYRRFFLKPGVPYDFNGVKDNVTYIHTTWEDNRENLSQSFIDMAEAMRREDPDKYEHLYGGSWMVRKEGVIYKNWEKIPEDEYPSGLPQWWGNDWGYGGDPDALVRMCYDPVTGTLYVKEICYQTGLLPRHIAERIIEDGSTLVHHYELKRDESGRPVLDAAGQVIRVPVYYSPPDCEVYCDPQRPDSIAELRKIYDISSVGAVNRDKSGRVAWLQGFKVKYVGEHIDSEVQGYSWKPNKDDDTIFTDEPQDGNDHAMDAINYAAFTHLHRLGISNQM
jgi:phage terminase large subunit